MTLKKAELDLDSGKVLTIETGHMALEASGSVTVRLGDTMILAVATASSKPREGIDFFPLIVDFEEKLYSVGKIPGGFFRREGKPSEKAILNARKIDRPIRPLFPEGYINDVQIVVTPLSVDQENPPDILGIIGASAALSISEIPFEGPIGAARIGKIGRDLIDNPTMSQMRESDMDIVVAGTKDKILMIEAGAKELPEEEILAAIKKGHDFIKKVVSLQEELIAKFGKKKIEVSAVSIDKKIEDFINKNYKEKIEKAIIITDKKEQMNELSLIQEKIKEELEKNDDIKSVLEKKPKDVSKIIENIEYDFMRNMILEKKKRLDGRGLKEIRHGSLAEKALLPVIPSKEKFPYALRLVSEALGSNGSTSMASTCGSTLALMDAGVKISSPVAGISIGLITDNDKWVTITDIQGLEDHLGDMDFKVTGTRKGVTAIQVDIKIKGLTYEILEVALNQAKEGRISILDKIEEAIKVPREELSEYAPRVISFKINPEKIGLVIGPGGKNIRRIIEETGVQVDIEDDGTVLITSSDSEGAKEAKRRIDEMTFEPKEGDVFKSKVVRIMQFGAFVELPGGKDGLVHISQLDKKRVAKVEDVVNVGDEVVVKVMEIDREGRINLTIKGVTSEDNQKVH